MEKDGRKNWRRSKEYRALRGALIENLEARGMLEYVYRDKAQEYMDLWVRRQELREDIAERGVVVIDEKRGPVENRSVTLELQTSKLMLAIYNALGFAEKAGSGRSMAAEDEL